MLPLKIVLNASSKQLSKCSDGSYWKQHTPDLYVYFNGKLIMCQYNKLNQSKYLSDKHDLKHKIIILQEDFDLASLYKVIDYFHGYRLEISTMKQLSACLNIFDFLEDHKSMTQIEQKIQQDIQSYDIFTLIQLAFSFGMQKIFDLCLCYLQFDQFQQIRYNKFSFLQCDFKLFQIILRRHHILKMRGEIQGLQPSQIQQVIRIYCQRGHFGSQIVKRLIDKYLVNLQKFEKIKTSLRLDKLAHKNIMQSANIDTDFYEADQVLNLIQIEQQQQSTPRKRKYSEQKIKQAFKQMKFSNQTPYIGIDESVTNSLLKASLQKPNFQQQYKITVKDTIQKNGKGEHPQIKIKQKAEHKQNPMPATEELQSIVSRISELRNEYEQALYEHDYKYKNLRRNSKSQLFSPFSNDLLTKAKLLKSSNLKKKDILLTVLQPVL